MTASAKTCLKYLLLWYGKKEVQFHYIKFSMSPGIMQLVICFQVLMKAEHQRLTNKPCFCITLKHT